MSNEAIIVSMNGKAEVVWAGVPRGWFNSKEDAELFVAALTMLPVPFTYAPKHIFYRLMANQERKGPATLGEQIDQMVRDKESVENSLGEIRSTILVNAIAGHLGPELQAKFKEDVSDTTTLNLLFQTLETLAKKP